MRTYEVRLATLAFLAVLVPATGFCSEWLFLPVGKDAGASYNSPDVDETRWHTVQMPHSTWDDLQNADSVYGWYRFHFVADPHFAGTDMVLKLGIVDDADETYCNGKLIGSTGGMPPNFRTAYNVDREYLIPADVINYGGDNTIAVKVFDTIGTGGVLGAPRLGYRLAQADSWSFWAAGKDYDSDLSAVEVKHDEWDQVPMPEGAWDELQPGDDTCGWYRLRFTAPASPEHTPLLDLGIILDADETYVNGQLIGSTGGFPPHAAEAGAEPRVYSVPDGIINWGGENVLAVKVFNGRARGGIWGRPAWLHQGAEHESEPLARGQSALAAGDWREAASAFEAALATAENEHTIGDALDGLAVALTELGRDDEALKAFTRLMSEYPAESCSLAAVRAIQSIQGRRGALSEECFFLEEDRATQGDWWLRYGNSGFVLSAMGGDCDIFGEPGWCAFVDPVTDEPLATPPFEFEVSTLDAQRSHHYNWQWAASTSDRRALQNPLTGSRTATCVDDKGEEHPFDNEGPDLRFEMQVPEGWHRVAFYMVDWDWWNTWHPRVQSIVLMDADGAPLSVADTGKFGQGVWLQFAVRGPRRIIARINKHRSINAVLSGAFLDADWLPMTTSVVGRVTPDSPVAALVERYEALNRSPPDLHARAGELDSALAAVADELDQGSHDATVAAWMRWQLAVLRSDGAEAAGERFLEKLHEQAGAAYPDVVAGVEEATRSEGRLEQARRLMDATTEEAAAAVAERDGDVIRDMSLRIAAWAASAPQYAAEVMDAMLAATEELPPHDRAEVAAALGSRFIDQDWRMPLCPIRGEVAMFYDRARIASMTTIAARVEEALAHCSAPPDAAIPNGVQRFTLGRAERALTKCRSMYRFHDLRGHALEVASRGLTMTRWTDCPDTKAELALVIASSTETERPALLAMLKQLDVAEMSARVSLQIAGAFERKGDLQTAQNILQRARETGGTLDGRDALRLAREHCALLARRGHDDEARLILSAALLSETSLQERATAYEWMRGMRALSSMAVRSGTTREMQSVLNMARRLRRGTLPAIERELDAEITAVEAQLSAGH